MTTDSPDGPFHRSRTSNGESEWFSARDAASGVSIPAKSREDADALVSSLNRACVAFARRPDRSPAGEVLEARLSNITRYAVDWAFAEEDLLGEWCRYADVKAILAAPSPAPAPEREGLVEALLTELRQIATHNGCGCAPICRCYEGEAGRYQVQEMQDAILAALAAYEESRK